MCSEFLLNPIAHWIADAAVSEIMLNAPQEVFIESNHTIFSQKVPEFTEQYLRYLFQIIANENHKILDEKEPMLSGSIKGKIRVQLVLPPITCFPAFSLRMHTAQNKSLHDLEAQGFFSPSSVEKFSEKKESMLYALYQNKRWREFCDLAVNMGKNIVISGATATGKTTFLRACLESLAPENRILVLEDTPEISLSHKNVLHLFSQKSVNKVHNAVSMQDILQCSLRLRPDRLVVGEVRGAEIVDYIAASLTGHRGVMTSIHASSPKEALVRMTQMYRLGKAAFGRSQTSILSELHQAVDIIFQIQRSEGRRYVEQIFFVDKPKHIS